MGKMTPCKMLMYKKLKPLSSQNMALGDKPGGATRSGITLRKSMKKAENTIADRKAEVCWKESRFLL